MRDLMVDRYLTCFKYKLSCSNRTCEKVLVSDPYSSEATALNKCIYSGHEDGRLWVAYLEGFIRTYRNDSSFYLCDVDKTIEFSYHLPILQLTSHSFFLTAIQFYLKVAIINVVEILRFCIFPYFQHINFSDFGFIQLFLIVFIVICATLLYQRG